MFKLLKQFDSTGKRDFKIEDFRELLDIPASYRISEINSKVLTKKNIEELEKVFKNLKIEKIKNRNEKGCKTNRNFITFRSCLSARN